MVSSRSVHMQELAEWMIRRKRARFVDRVWPVDGARPELIRERLAALEDAERRRSGELRAEQ
jgi:hypothetical protein